MKAHQDDNVAFDKLSRKLQLNCICNHLAKQHISNLAQQQQRNNSLFPLEPIGVFIEGAKLSSDTGQLIQFQQKKIVSGNGFDKVGWDSVHSTLHLVLRLFQVWASKHVLRIAGTMKFLSHRMTANPYAPAASLAKRHAATLRYAQRLGAPKPFNSQLPASPLGWQRMQHIQTLRQSSLPMQLGEVKAPALTVQLTIRLSSKTLHCHKTKLVGGTSWWE